MRYLANTISKYTNSRIQYIDNPRNELSEKNYMLKMMNSSHWGFGPIYLKDGLFDEIRNIVEKYKDRVIKEKILPKKTLEIEWEASIFMTHLTYNFLKIYSCV